MAGTKMLHAAIPDGPRREIEARLAGIEAADGVRLLLAVESGSRAWGFPSPDSDYDVRFVYARPRDWYLALTPGRDVIETPIEDDIDLNGWDIRKTLKLLLKSNAVVSEWLDSPLRYRPDHPVVGALAALADAVFDPRTMALHYASLGRTPANRWLSGDDVVPVKRYFYALRPALAIRAIRRDPSRRPPMDLPSLVAGGGVGPSLAARIDDLVAAKARTNEASNGLRVAEIDALIWDELGRAGEIPAGRDRDPRALEERANALFLDLVSP